jgi:hypothetical protein
MRFHFGSPTGYVGGNSVAGISSRPYARTDVLGMAGKPNRAIAVYRAAWWRCRFTTGSCQLIIQQLNNGLLPI